MTVYDVGSRVFGGWELTRLIGQGGFGSVFEAEKSGYGLTVKSAVKVVRIPPSQSMVTSALAEGMDEASVASYFGGLVEDFMGEVALLSSLGHPGVVEYHDHEIVKDEEGIGWSILLRMELLECLTDRILREPLSRDKVLRLGEEIADVLAYCHERNIIHRDVKPENVFVDAEGRFKLGDFGVSRVVEGTSGTLSQKGTVGYMAPELFRGDRYDASVDVYALGLVLYRLLNSNRLPFLPPAPAPITFADRNRVSALRMAGEEVPKPEGIDDATFSVISAACAFDPAARPSAAALRDALRELRRGTAARFESGLLPVSDGQTVNLGEFFQGSEAGATSAAPAAAMTFATTSAPGMTVGIWDVFGKEQKPEVPAASETERIRISEATFEPIPAQPYEGEAVRPAIAASYDGLPLQEGVDFSVTYDANDAPGKAKACLTGLGRFKGSKTLSFSIEAKRGALGFEQGTRPDFVKHESPAELTPAQIDAIARDVLENQRHRWMSKDAFRLSSWYSGDDTSGKTRRLIESARKQICNDPTEKVYLFNSAGAIFFPTGRTGVVISSSGHYYRYGEPWDYQTRFVSWQQLCTCVSPNPITWDGRHLGFDNDSLLFCGEELVDLFLVMRDELLYPRDSIYQTDFQAELHASPGDDERARAKACRFLESYVDNPPYDYRIKLSSQSAEAVPLQWMSLLGNHGEKQEKYLRAVLGIPAGEAIFVACCPNYNSRKKARPEEFEPALAFAESGTFVTIEDRDGYHVRFTPWHEFAKAMERDLVINTSKDPDSFVHKDGSIFYHPVFSFSVGSTLFDVGRYEGSAWQVLFDGLEEALR